MASPDPSAAPLGVQDDMAPNTEQNIPAPAVEAPAHNNALSGINQPTAVNQLLHTSYDAMGQMVFQIGCPCPFCQQCLVQQRQQLYYWALNIDHYEALIRPQPDPRDFITKPPKEVLNMIVSYVMGGFHDWHHSPPKTPMYAQQQVTPYGYAPSMAKRGAGYLTDERLLGLSQTCKVFRDVCHGFGAHDYLMVWAEYDHFKG